MQVERSRSNAGQWQTGEYNISNLPFSQT